MPGKSYIKGVTSCKDRIGHGTAVAGIIQKYAPNAQLVPLMFYSKYASGVPNNGGVKAICKAIYDAVDSYHCKIINISSGIYSQNDELETAVEYAESKDVIIISAVGNDNKVSSDRIFYPAAYSTVIGVGAIKENFEIANFSQSNRSVMTVMYGVDLQVISIKNGTDYTTVSGTSYSAAIVSGIAAKVAQKYPDITPSEFRRLIGLSCRDLGEPGYDVVYGYGFLDKDRIITLNKK